MLHALKPSGLSSSKYHSRSCLYSATKGIGILGFRVRKARQGIQKGFGFKISAKKARWRAFLRKGLVGPKVKGTIQGID